MARFRGTVFGGRGEASRLGHTEIDTACNGWTRGVRVLARAEYENPDLDTFSIDVDGGSNYGGRHFRLATIAGDGTISIHNAKGETVMVLADLVEE